ncbi:MAG: chorismate mutase [Hyphomicrobiales bacterium]|nr:chorismate mutase [Hyphomicrobiales bacterium]
MSNDDRTLPTLASLRDEIDRIDEALHRLLIERGEIIDALISIKRTEATGSAFRPAREADMLRRLVERHRGILPVDTVESIWRVIISTFTYVQAPYSVHIVGGPESAANRDVARFHFGFTPPLIVHDDAGAVLQAVDAARGDLGLLHAGAHNDSAWWEILRDPGAPKIIARLPLVERADHPADRPHYVIAKAVSDAAATDITLFAATVAAAPDAAGRARLDGTGVEVIDQRKGPEGVSLLVAVDQAVGGTPLGELLAAALSPLSRLDPVGSHAAPFVFTGKPSASIQSGEGQ